VIREIPDPGCSPRRPRRLPRPLRRRVPPPGRENDQRRDRAPVVSFFHQRSFAPVDRTLDVDDDEVANAIPVLRVDRPPARSASRFRVSSSARRRKKHHGPPVPGRDSASSQILTSNGEVVARVVRESLSPRREGRQGRSAPRGRRLPRVKAQRVASQGDGRARGSSCEARPGNCFPFSRVGSTALRPRRLGAQKVKAKNLVLEPQREN